MRTVFRALPSALLLFLNCSDPTLFNPNDPNDPNYIDIAVIQPLLRIATVPTGVQFDLPDTSASVIGYQIEKLQTGTTWPAIQVSASEAGEYQYIDSTITWLDTCEYIVKAKTASGLSKTLIDTVIGFGIAGDLYLNGTTSDSAVNQALLVYPTSLADRQLITGGMLLPHGSAVDTIAGEMSGDELRFTIQDLPWGATLEYQLQLVAGANDSISAPIAFEITHSPLSVTLQFLGGGDMDLTFEQNTITAPDPSRIFIHPALIQSYSITYNSSAFPSSVNSLPWHTELAIPAGQDSIRLDSLVVQLEGNKQSFYIPVAQNRSIINPPELQFMRLVTPSDGNTTDPFFIDMYEITVAEWTSRTGNAPNWMDGWMTGVSDTLKPVGFIGYNRVLTYLNSDSKRHLPNIDQWQAAGGTTDYSNGYDMITQETANTFSSHDNFEGNNGFPAVPVDFFEHVGNAAYLVNGNRPAPDLNPFGVYQLTGNLFEWILNGNDTTISGGSFWSSISDSLLLRTSSLNPTELIRDDRAEYGLRTVLTDSLSKYQYTYDF